MHRISSLPAPVLVGVVREKGRREAIAKIRNYLYHDAKLIDLHMSCLEDRSPENLSAIIHSTALPILALDYNNTADWNPCGLSEEERAAGFLQAIDCGAAGIDMQGYTFDEESKIAFHGEDKYSFTRANPREVVTDEAVISKQCDLIERVHAKGGEVLLSCHPNVTLNTEQVVDLALFLEKRHPDVIKIVTIAHTDEEMLESFRSMLTVRKEVATPVSLHAGGPKGSLTRVINPALGGFLAFCVDGYTETSTMAQVDLRTAAAVIDGLTKIRMQ